MEVPRPSVEGDAPDELVARRAIAHELLDLGARVSDPRLSLGSLETLLSGLRSIRVGLAEFPMQHAAEGVSLTGSENGIGRDDVAGAHFGGVHPFVSNTSSIFPSIRWDVDEDELRCYLTFGRAFEGPPSTVHGGFIAAGFDIVISVLGTRCVGYGVTRRLAIRYYQPTYLEVEYCYRARLEQGEGRLVNLGAELADPDGNVSARCTGEFVSIDEGRFFSRARNGRSGR